MTRRVELTEFVNDNLAWECDPELVDDIVDLIEMKVKEDTLSLVEKVVGDVKQKGLPDKPISYYRIHDLACDEVLTRIKKEIGE